MNTNICSRQNFGHILRRYFGTKKEKAAYRIRKGLHRADSTGGFRFQSEDLLDSSTLSDYILILLDADAHESERNLMYG
jgi:hypothetical protein